MKLLLPLSLTGALIGGFPGALLAFIIAGDTRSEAAICLTNIAMSIGGAFIGLLVARAIRPDKVRGADVLLPVILGLVCGMLGWTWLFWEISHADPPL